MYVPSYEWGERVRALKSTALSWDCARGVIGMTQMVYGYLFQDLQVNGLCRFQHPKWDNMLYIYIFRYIYIYLFIYIYMHNWHSIKCSGFGNKWCLGGIKPPCKATYLVYRVITVYDSFPPPLKQKHKSFIERNAFRIAFYQNPNNFVKKNTIWKADGATPMYWFIMAPY